MSRILIEAESFKNLGGWIVDQQSMNVMGSSYVMAHGMGEPVPDATTYIELPHAGTWYAYARTRDWTAVWKRGHAPGLFKIKANDTYFDNTLGNNGEKWDWQAAGALDLPAGRVKLSLCDLTGFNGRCDALFFTDDPADVPVNTEEFRRSVSHIVCEEDERDYDLVICGGGMAGLCMALTAIREGATVALIQDRPVLGGCNSSEIKVGLGGWSHAKPYEKLGNVVDQVSPVFGRPGSYPEDRYEDARKRNAFYTIPDHLRDNYSLNLNERVVEIEQNGDKIVAVRTKNIYTGQMKRYHGKLFADCTGDAFLARQAGAEVMYGREPFSAYRETLAPEKADNQVMGMTITWYSQKEKEPVSFPDIDWGFEFDDERCYRVDNGDWEWEVGQYRNMADETEYIRDFSLMTIFGNWSFLKNRAKDKADWANHALMWVSPLGGKRESYRVKGDLVLNQNDIEQKVPYEDGTGSLTWDIDIHYPDAMNVKLFPEPFRSCAIHHGIGHHYPVPYRCLYSKDISNLFLGGRIVSTTHVAFACVRVMRTLGVLGEVVGMAAAICARENCLPRDIYTTHFDKLRERMEQGVTINPMHAYGSGTYEHLAFPETNQLPTYPGVALPLDDKDWMYRINNSGIQFHNWQKYRGIENRDELTDEEKEIARKFHEGVGW